MFHQGIGTFGTQRRCAFRLLFRCVPVRANNTKSLALDGTLRVFYDVPPSASMINVSHVMPSIVESIAVRFDRDALLIGAL